MSHPHEAPHPDHPMPVEMRIGELMDSGAKRVIPAFSTAGEGQGDLIYQGRRLLVTPNDDEYKQYVEVMTRSGVPHLANDPELGRDDVVVGEIPRDARVVPQILRSIPSREGLTPRDVFCMLGRRIGTLASEQHLVPVPERFSMKNVLVLRKQADVLIIPPLAFQEENANSRPDLVKRMQNDLWPAHARFGAVALLHAFEKGLES